MEGSQLSLMVDCISAFWQTVTHLSTNYAQQ